jgi:hypothetical protein
MQVHHSNKQIDDECLASYKICMAKIRHLKQEEITHKTGLEPARTSLQQVTEFIQLCIPLLVSSHLVTRVGQNTRLQVDGE